ncbi:MAG: glycosyltransferase [Syntrophorhabdaceae bacterium]|nr:glycosyltransferase [Syntrophorhabdaceae bacterium]
MSICKRILYLGANEGTSAHRANALRRIGHEVDIVNIAEPGAFFPKHQQANRILNKFIYEGGAWAVERCIRPLLNRAIQKQRYDIAWVDQGVLISPDMVKRLKDSIPIVINYNVDDPFPSKDKTKKRFSVYRKALPIYDLVVVVRVENIAEAYEAGARKVLRVYFSADEVAHAPLKLTLEDRSRFASEVSFIGTWMPERGPFLARLLELGVPLTIYGERWKKSKEWPILRSVWQEPQMGVDYVRAIQCSKICLGLLSKRNRDLHTTRSVEIPYIGSLFCAERTSEHEAMYKDNKEAVFWSTAEECAEKILWLLKNKEVRLSITKAGQRRCQNNKFLNEIVVKQILGNI